MSPFLAEVLSAWLDRLAATGPARLAAGLLVGALVYAALGAPALRARLGRHRPALRWTVGGLAVVGAALGAVQIASVVDDAFISLRYARNLVEGHGLVYNPGERVEGTTNLLWTLLVAGVHVATGAGLPAVALGLALTAAVATVALAAARGPARSIPVAALLLASNAVFRSHASTGLETALVGLLGLGALVALSRPGRARAAAASACLVLATLARPDQILFWAAGLAAVLLGGLGGVAWRELLVRTAAYLAPASLLVGVTAWRVGYYGAWVPNTAWAKSADLSWWSQGFVYGAEFWLGTHAWALLVPFTFWLAGRGAAGDRTLRVYGGLAVALHVTYVLKIGGDFMAGRFWVALLPVLAWAAEDVLAAGARGGARARTALLAGLLVAAAGERSLVRPGSIRWYLADEGTIYPVVRWSPIVIDHPSWRIGHAVGTSLAARDLQPWMATGTIGMVGFYGRLPLVDLHGLTDATVAREPIGGRGHVGHEKFARRAYLLERGVRLVMSPRLCRDSPHPELTTLTLRGRPEKPWCLLSWDRTLMARLAQEAPEWGFVPFEPWLDDYLGRLDALGARTVRRDLAWFDEYYFSVSPDAARRATITAWLEEQG